MTGKAKAAGLLAALLSAGVAAVATAQFTGGSPRVVGLIAQPATSFGVASNCQVTPGKVWGGKMHFSYAILKPSVLQKACWTQRPAPLGTLVKVSLSPVPAAPAVLAP